MLSKNCFSKRFDISPHSYGLKPVAMGAHSHTKLLYHVVFATKRRAPFLTEENLPCIIADIATKANVLGVDILAMNGYIDHLHLLLRLAPDHKLSEIIGQLKGYSSHQNSEIRWQIGYSAFTLHEEIVPVVRKYIENQRAHHESMDYRGEISQLRKFSKDSPWLWA